MRVTSSARIWPLLIISFYSSRAVAWPVFVPYERLAPFIGKDKENLVAFSATDSGWQLVPLQVDELGENGDRLQWNPDFEDPRRKQFYEGVEPHRSLLGAGDELVLDEHSFSNCNQQCRSALHEGYAWACGVSKQHKEGKESKKNEERLVEVLLTEERERSLFVTWCPKKREPMPNAVQWDQTNHLLESKNYRYVYNENNSLLLDEFALRDENGKQQTLLEKSILILHAKPKFFFPMTFTGDDITSELMGFSAHPVSSTGELSFTLKVLSFKIKLNLLSAISMYRDAIEVPAILTLPVSGSLLREGSGVLYGFRFPGGDFRQVVRTDMPWLPPPGHAIPFSQIRTFSLVRGNQAVVAAVRMPKSFKSMRFSPALATAKELEEWDFPTAAADFGIFYDITRLRKGRHRLSVWFLTGSVADISKMERMASRRFPLNYRVHQVQ